MNMNNGMEPCIAPKPTLQDRVITINDILAGETEMANQINDNIFGPSPASGENGSSINCLEDALVEIEAKARGLNDILRDIGKRL
jgi:hypothetical protein